MPNPLEIATVVAGGKKYSDWQSVQITKRYDDIIMHMQLTVAEKSQKLSPPFSILPGPAQQQLMPGVSAQGYLAGKLAITGQVCRRQPAYDKNSHLCQIVVAGKSMIADVSSVDGTPGFYKNYTLAQIAQAVLGKVGVPFQIKGSPPGADKIFPRVSEHIGETRYHFISRLCEMRNLYLCPDSGGGLVATRGTGGVCANLIEGGNILSARLLLRNDDYANPSRSIGANFGGSLTTIDDNACRDVVATVTSPNMAADRPCTVMMPQPGDNEDAAMYAARVAALNLATYIDGDIAVPGWLIDGGGDLWLDHVGDLVAINSPMLVPGGKITLALKGVVSRQDSEDGTQSVLEVCDPGALGALNRGQSEDGPAVPLIGAPQQGQ
jgi:prophage tail gpP-like protein